MSETLTEKLLKINAAYITAMFGEGEPKKLDPEINFPRTLHALYQHAELEGMESVLLDVCSNNDHYVFPADEQSWIRIKNKMTSKPAAATGNENKNNSQGNIRHTHKHTHTHTHTHTYTCTQIRKKLYHRKQHALCVADRDLRTDSYWYAALSSS